MKKKIIPLIIVMLCIMVLGGCSNEARSTDGSVELSPEDSAFQTETATEEPIKEYTFEELTGYDSPLLGYWQGEDCAAYIGYNTTKSNEGFIIWLKVRNIDMLGGKTILNSHTGYTFSGDSHSIIYKPQANGSGVIDKPEVTVSINSADNMTISFDYSSFEGHAGNYPVGSYDLTRSDMDKSIIKNYEGHWICPENDYGESEETDVSFDYKDGLIIDNNMYADEDLVSFSLFDGKEIIFVMPYEAFDNGSFPIGYKYKGYIVEGDVLRYTRFSEVGLETSLGNQNDFYREGSEELEVQTAIAAYQDYIREHDSEYFQAGLAYLFASDIPVLFMNKNTSGIDGMFMFMYDNGEIRELGNYNTDFNYGYGHYGTVGLIERQGIVIVSDVRYGYYTSYYWKLDGSGSSSLIHGFYIENYDSPEGEQKYFMDDVEVSKEEWESETNIIESTGRVTYPFIDEKYNLIGAYNKLKLYDGISKDAAEYGDTIRAKHEKRYKGAMGETDWEGDEEVIFVISPYSSEFQNGDYELPTETLQANVKQALGKKVGESFELEFEYGDGNYFDRYTILEIN